MKQFVIGPQQIVVPGAGKIDPNNISATLLSVGALGQTSPMRSTV